MICLIKGCTIVSMAKGLCRKHYLRMWKRGTTDDRVWQKYPAGTILTISILKELLSYNKETGLFTWNVPPSKKVAAGTNAGSSMPGDYVRIIISRKIYLAHRLAWFYMKGEWPYPEVDHRNGVRADNRWKNLRKATRAFNAQNVRKARSDSSTGVLGATPNKKGFMAKIQASGKIHHLGTFRTTQEAHAAYVEAKRKLHPGGTL